MLPDSSDIDLTPTDSPIATREQPSQVCDTSPEAAPLAATEGATTAMPAESRPSQRIQIGSQRDAGAAQEVKAKPVMPAVPGDVKKASKQYPPPNIRSQLSPELDAEYQAALGDVSLDELLDQAGLVAPSEELASETRVTCRVASIHREDVFFDLGGGPYQGTVPLKQFDEPPVEGSQIELVVVRFNLEEGLYELSRPTAAVDIGNWDEVEEGQIVGVTVTGSNKGGLECQIAGLRGFIPLGQVSLYRIENPEEFVGQRLACVVTEANRDRRNLVLSHRAVMERERNEQREKTLSELAPGQIREGVVRSLKDFGAFVDLGGVDGLIHISQLSWDRVAHPSEVVEIGQKVKVRIEKFDPDTGKVSLSYREVGESPWEKVDQKYPVGLRVTGSVSRIMDFGAFVKIEPGVEGLVHISELGHGRVFRVADVVSEGQQVEVKVLSVDREKQRISLSLKALLEKPVKEDEKKISDEDLEPPADAPKPPKKATHLKGGIGGPSGGEKFGLNW
ncbi:MAG: S1 RNA-binding domain-containing protein [Planctomycetes bacterium]|nr:S1 RNA-binding domain-containing protein [Planctomycetota bacterium]